jgi:hypothetical protein
MCLNPFINKVISNNLKIKNRNHKENSTFEYIHILEKNEMVNHLKELEL